MNSCPERRSDHERRLGADDLRQAIEEVYQPTEQAIAAETAAKVASGIAPFRRDALYLSIYSDVSGRTLRAPDQDRVPGGFPTIAAWGHLFNSEATRRFHMLAKSISAQTDGRLPKP
jgi:hypothetical protein